jgi:hypothetical protein
MLGPIRTYFFEKEKEKRLSGAGRRISQYKKDRKNHFGILLDASLTDVRAEVIAFAERLRKEGHRVKILGYVDGRPERVSMPFDFFTSADIHKVSMIPKSPEVETFIEQPFDVLINLSIRQNHKSLEYISAVSRASFRVGPWYPHQISNPYDLCLDAGSTASLREWIHELMHTLQKIY